MYFKCTFSASSIFNDESTFSRFRSPIFSLRVSIASPDQLTSMAGVVLGIGGTGGWGGPSFIALIFSKISEIVFVFIFELTNTNSLCPIKIVWDSLQFQFKKFRNHKIYFLIVKSVFYII